MIGSPTKTICFFNSNRAWGGGEKWHFTMARQLQQSGFKTLLVTNHNSELYQKAMGHQLTTFSFSISNLSFLNPIKIFVLALFFKTKQVDTVILNLPSDLKCAGIAARLAGVKKIIYRRGMPHPIRNSWLNRWLFQKVLTDVIVNSLEIKRSLLEKNEAWFPSEKIKLLYNGISLSESPLVTGTLFEKKSGEWILGNAGRLTEQKGQIYLIEMAALLLQKKIPFKLLIAGSGELRESLQAAIKSRGLENHVILLGHVDDMAKFMNTIDIFIFPSLFEGAANTLIETLFYGKPIVAFNLSSNPEIIQHERNGLLAKPLDAEDLSQCVIRFMESPEFRAEMVRHGHKLLCEKFDAKKLLEDLKAII